jgi:hypothetical protein
VGHAHAVFATEKEVDSMKKHTKQMLWGGILFVIGGLFVPLIAWVVVFISIFNNRSLSMFLIPAVVEISIEKEGHYYLWNDYETVFEGKTYSVDKEIPRDITISLIDKSGTNKSAIVPDLSVSSSSFGSNKNSIGYFDLDKPGQYLLEVSGQSQPRVFSFGSELFSMKRIAAMFIIGSASVMTAILGFILIVTGLVNYFKDKKHTIPESITH